MIEALKKLKMAYALIDKSQFEFQKLTGLPVCVKCGSCCNVTSVRVSGIEAAYTAYWLKFQSSNLREKVLFSCEEWATRVDTNLQVYGQSNEPQQQDRLSMEVAYLLMESSCPLLNERRRCDIYQARPIICRLFGLTRKTGNMCRRERPNIYMNGVRKNRIKEALLSIPYGDFDYSKDVGFLPVLLFRELEPTLFQSYADADKIPAAKVVPQVDTNFYWQDQMDEYSDREREHDFLTNPIPV